VSGEPPPERVANALEEVRTEVLAWRDRASAELIVGPGHVEGAGRRLAAVAGERSVADSVAQEAADRLVVARERTSRARAGEDEAANGVTFRGRSVERARRYVQATRRRWESAQAPGEEPTRPAQLAQRACRVADEAVREIGRCAPMVERAAAGLGWALRATGEATDHRLEHRQALRRARSALEAGTRRLEVARGLTLRTVAAHRDVDALAAAAARTLCARAEALRAYDRAEATSWPRGQGGPPAQVGPRPMATMGALSAAPPVEPRNGALKEKMPPSEATSQ